MSDSLWPSGPQHSRLPCPSPTPGVHPNSCPLSRWCHATISPSVVPFSSRLQSFPATGSFQMSQLFSSGGQSIGVSASASVLPVNVQDWFPLGWSGWISLQSKKLMEGILFFARSACHWIKSVCNWNLVTNKVWVGSWEGISYSEMRWLEFLL